MVTPHVRQSLRSGWKSLRMSENELKRPAEDAVALCACIGSRNAVTDFLRSYLLSRKVDIDSRASMQELMDRCVAIDPEFNLIDLSCFACGKVKTDDVDTHYCLGLGNVSDCCDRAGRIGDLVMEKLDVAWEQLEA